MTKFSRDLIEEVKAHVSIVDLARDYFQLTTQKGYLGIIGIDGDGDYSSLKIYPETNSYCRFSGKGGGDVIQFVRDTHINGIDSFDEAVIFLKQRIDPNFSVDIEKNKAKNKKWINMTSQERVKKMAESHKKLTEDMNVDDNNRYIIAYLKQTRGIDIDIVYDEIKNGRINQIITKNGSRALACVGKDFDYPAITTAVSVRGIRKDSTFKGDLVGCNYDVGWVIHNHDKQSHLCSFKEKSHIYCFEGYIDYLSFKSIQKMHNNSMTKDICIVTGSATKTKSIINFLATNKESFTNGNITLCFDNDTAGYKATEKVAKELKELDMKLKIDTAISYDKDWNDQLLNFNKDTNQLAYRIDLNKDNIIKLSKNKGKDTLCTVYEDMTNETNVIMLDHENDNIKLYDCSKDGLNSVYDYIEERVAKTTFLDIHTDYLKAVKEDLDRYPNITSICKLELSDKLKKRNISQRMIDAKAKAANQPQHKDTKTKNIDIDR